MANHNFISRATALRTDLEPDEKLLLIVLRAFQDPETGHCTPSKQSLCAACGCVTNTLKKNRNSLKDKGVISWTSSKTVTEYEFRPFSVAGGSNDGVGQASEIGGPSNDLPY